MKRQGFSLPLVLIVMIFIIGISAVIMDMTTNYVGSSQATIDHQKLYNAAQSGLEDAKAWLYENRADLQIISEDVVPTASSDLFVKVSGSTYSYSDLHEGIDSVNVYVLTCDYMPPTGGYIQDLPPVYEEYFPPGTSSQVTGEGQSGFIDPNRNILGLNTTGGRVFVIRSIAELEQKKTGIEAMVVIPNEE